MVLGATTPQEGPKAASFMNLAVQLGGSISVALLAVLIHQREQFHSEHPRRGTSRSRTRWSAIFCRTHFRKPTWRWTHVHAVDDPLVRGRVDCDRRGRITCMPLIFLMRKRKTTELRMRRPLEVEPEAPI